jgi:glycosyl hydrolase family 26
MADEPSNPTPESPIPRRRFLGRSAAIAGVVAVAPMSRWLGARDAPTATPARDPSIVGSWGGLTVPEVGAYWGADDTTRGFTGAKGIETQLGRRMAIRNRRYGWLATCPSPAATADAQLGAPKVVPMCSFMKHARFPVKNTGWQGGGDASTTSFGRGIDRIANGEFDAYWARTAQALRALGVPVIVRLWMEMNGKHNPYASMWQGGVGVGEASFAAAWRHVHDVFRLNGATLGAGGNCIFVFCAQRMSTSGSWKRYWPGDEFVDWSGLDLYRTNFVNGTQHPSGDMDTYDWAVAHGKPFIVCEAGFDQGKIVTTPQGRFDKDGTRTGHSLIADAQAMVKANPQCVAYVHWNNVGPLTNDFVDTSAQSLAQYRSFANDPYVGLVRA